MKRIKKKSSLPKRVPFKSPYEPEDKLLRSSRRSLSAFKQYQKPLPIHNTIFDLRARLPYRKPSRTEVMSELPELFTKSPFIEFAHPLTPAPVLEKIEKGKSLLYYWERDRGYSKDLFQWVIPKEWGDYSTILLGQHYRSALFMVAYVWHAQQRHPEWQDALICLRGEEKPYIFNQDSVLFVPSDILRTIYGVEKPSPVQILQFDRLLKSIFSLSYYVATKVTKGRHAGQWQGYIYGRVVHKLILGTRRNPQARIVELAPEYQLKPKRFLHLPKESQEAYEERLAEPPYWTGTSPRDIVLESKLTTQEAALYDFYFRRGGGYTFVPGHTWGIARFYKDVLHCSDSYIKYLERNGKLISHLRTVRESLNTKLEKEGILAIKGFQVLPKESSYQDAGLTKIKFEHYHLPELE